MSGPYGWPVGGWTLTRDGIAVPSNAARAVIDIARSVTTTDYGTWDALVRAAEWCGAHHEAYGDPLSPWWELYELLQAAASAVEVCADREQEAKGWPFRQEYQLIPFEPPRPSADVWWASPPCQPRAFARDTSGPTIEPAPERTHTPDPHPFNPHSDLPDQYQRASADASWCYAGDLDVVFP